MTRKTKRIIARILAVVMAVTLIPSNMWGTAGVVMAEEMSEAFTEEDDDVIAEDVQEPQEKIEEKETSVVATEMEEPEPVDVDEVVEDDKDAEAQKGKKETEKVSAEVDNKAEDGVYVHNFTGTDGSYYTTSTYFTLSGTEKSGVSTVKYNSMELTKAMKVTSSAGVTFSAPSGSVLILVYTLDSDSGGVKVDGVSEKVSKNADVGGYVLELTLDQDGKHTVLRDSKEAYLYYISVTEPSRDKVESPTAVPADSAVVKLGETIELNCETQDAEIYYTIKGEERTYSNAGIKVEDGMQDSDNKITITACAKKDGYADSDQVTFTYTLSMEKGDNQLEMPTAEPEPGEVPRGTEVILKSEDGASIYYTTDGSHPSTSSTRTLFDEATPIVINEEITIKAIAEEAGKDNSFVASFTYTIKRPTICVDDSSTAIISDVEFDGDVIFENQDKKEVFDVKVKAQKVTTPDPDIKEEAENLTKNGEILYYDFTLVNAQNTNDSVNISSGKLKIKMPYSIAAQTANKRNEVLVLHNTTPVEVTKETDGFSFAADSFSPYTVIINPTGGIETISITESGGYEEGAYAEWEAVEDADGYMAYVAPAGGEFTRIDDELIREYEDYWRVDTVGLAKGTYYIKVNAVILGKDGDQDTATVIATKTTKALRVTNYDRSGFAFSKNSNFKTGSGAYNDDGTLREGAQVLYVTAETATTVTAMLHTAGADKPAVEYTGLQTILDSKNKGDATKDDILDIRIIGCISKSDLDHISSSEEGLQIKGKNNYSEMNITVEGIGEDAVVKDFGFLIRYCGNVELRNFALMTFMDDGVSMDTGNCNIWVHDLDIFYGSAGGDSDQAKGDGSIDIKAGSTYITVAYNHFWDSGKCSLCGMEDATDDEFMVTYHHNWFDHSDSRHARVRRGTVHIYNNYYDGNSKYGIGAANASSIFVESNYFRNCKYPMIISTQASDALGGNIMSGEDGGMIKAYNNTIIGANNLVYQNSNSGTAAANSTSFDAYLVLNRTDTVPSSVKTLSGDTSYNNFDTSSSYDLGVTEDKIDTPENVPTVVMAKAGRLNGGDFQWTFDNAKEDTNFAVIPELKSLVVNYKTSVKKISGGITGDPIIIEDTSSSAPGGDDQIVEKPTADVDPGEVAVGTTIALSCSTAGANIYYTLTGLAPSDKDILYTEPIVINKDTTIKAIAILGTSESDVSSFKYTIPGGETPLPSDPGSGDEEVKTYEFNPEMIGFDLTDTETDSVGTVKQIYKMPADDTKYGTDAYFTIGNNSTQSGKIAKTSTTGGKTKAPVPSKSSVTEYTVRYQFGGTVSTADDPRAIRFTTENKAKVYVAAYRTGDQERNLYLDTDDNVQILSKNATEYTFDIEEAGTHGIYAKDGDIAILYVIVEEVVPNLAQPAITPASKDVENGEQVTVTITKAKDDPEDIEIYYTTDGTVPEKNDKLLYTEPFTITVNETTTINAIAVKDGLISSTTASVTYTVKENNTPNPPTGTGLRVVLKNKNEVYTYTGSAIKPDIEVWNNSDRLVEGVDYTVKYKNNVNASANVNENKKPQITVTGKGNLTGNASTTFEIAAKSLIDSDVAVAGIEQDGTLGEMLLVVENTKPAPALYYGAAKLTKKDYTVSLTDKCVAGDTGKAITITGTGNFSGTLTYKLKVIKKDQLKKFAVTFTAPDYTYNGSAQKFTLAEGDVKDNSRTDTDGKKLIMGTDYTIVYQSDTINAGKVKFTVVGLGYYTGAVAKTYTIKPLAATSGFAFTGVDASYPYVGTGVTIPAAGITYNGTVLEEGRDYKLTYGNNKKVGTAKITAAFMGNYKGSKIDPKTFEITQGMLNNQTEGLKIAIADKIYNKPGVYKSAPYVSVNGVEVKSSEYTVKYYTGVHADGSIDTNTEMGSKNKVELSDIELNKPVYVEITGKGKNYAANMKLTASYKVYKVSGSVVDLSKAKLTVCKDWNVTDTTDKANKTSKMEYTGMSVEPGVMIELKDGNNKTLSPKQVKELMDAESPQITVQYVNNINKGKATIVINGDGVNYVGGKTITFSITTMSLKNTDIMMNLFQDIDKIIKG